MPEQQIQLNRYLITYYCLASEVKLIGVNLIAVVATEITKQVYFSFNVKVLAKSKYWQDIRPLFYHTYVLGTYVYLIININQIQNIEECSKTIAHHIILNKIRLLYELEYVIL